MRATASILHLDLDAFFAAVEQRDKPSLRGRPVVVGGTGTRGVVSTASYEARVFGIRSAMSIAEARARCPHAAYLGGRFEAYRATSAIVMEHLRGLSPLVEPLSLDEAFVDLGPEHGEDLTALAALVDDLRAQIADLTGGITCSVGVATSKLMAKIGSELHKPNGSTLIAPGTEQEVLGPLPVTAIGGVGPATATRLRSAGVVHVRDLWRQDESDLVALLGQASGTSLFRLARGIDDRAVEPHREVKSVSVEDTFDRDIADRTELGLISDAMARRVAERLRGAGQSGRTVTLKLRHHDFTTVTRSATLPAPTDQSRLIASTARRLLDAADVDDGLRLLGVGVSGLADWVQDDLFTADEDDPDAAPAAAAPQPAPVPERRWVPGMDVHHEDLGDGWVWGRGLGRVTVRFETRWTPPGPVRTFAADDPRLTPGHREGPADPAGTVEP